MVQHTENLDFPVMASGTGTCSGDTCQNCPPITDQEEEVEDSSSFIMKNIEI